MHFRLHEPLQVNQTLQQELRTTRFFLEQHFASPSTLLEKMQHLVVSPEFH
jgi:hypothetical protein